MYFNDGVSTVLVGPAAPEITGFKVVQVLDIYGVSHNILVLTVAKQLFAIFSTTEFMPDSSSLGYTSLIKVGINLINRSTLTNVANPVNDNDAVNKISLSNAVKLATTSLSIDITNFTGDKNQTIITQYLNKIFPVNEYSVANVAGPKCRVICTDTNSVDQPVTIRQFILDGTWQHSIDL